MHRLLVAYTTYDGHTAEIAERISLALRHTDCAVELCDLARSRPERPLHEYDGVICGGSRLTRLLCGAWLMEKLPKPGTSPLCIPLIQCDQEREMLTARDAEQACSQINQRNATQSRKHDVFGCPC